MSCESDQTSQIFVGDIGTVFKFTVKDEEDSVVDLSSASLLQITFKKPLNGGNLVKTATLFTDGTDGICKYTTIAGDIDIAGEWQAQVYVVVGSQSLHSTIQTFSVKANL